MTILPPGGSPPGPLPGMMANTALVPTMRFDLRTKDVFVIGGKTCEFERRLDGKLQFLQVQDKDVRMFTDEQLAVMTARGEARIVAGSASYARPRKPMPNILTLTPAQNAEADRKLTYVVAAVAGHDEGEEAPCTPSRFLKSRRTIMPVVEHVARRLGENPPDFTTILSWVDLWVRLGPMLGKACLVGLHMHKGDRRKRLGHVAEIALQRGLARWLKPKVTTKIAYAKVYTTVMAYKRKLRRHLTDEQLREIEAPSLRTFQRRCKEVDHYTRDYYRIGAAYANRVYAVRQTQGFPDRPYQDVEVDNCTLDILLVDDESEIVFGRPEIIVFRDRATGMIVGWSLDYECSSFAGFVDGLRHAMYPKDLSRFPAIRGSLPCFGKIANLWVDNGLSFISSDIARLCKQLGMNKPRFRPRCPWYKGALERFFGYFNTGLVHMLPGTTLSNVVKRRENEASQEDGAKIRVSDFEALFAYFNVEVHNAGLSRGLGFLRGVGDVPNRLWAEKAEKYPAAPLPPPELFMALCGEWETRTIQRDGITWDYLKYESPDLITLITHPDHRSGTEYDCVRDPSDLGRIYVENPYDPERGILVIPATKAHRAYAEGLHRHRHNLAIVNAQRMSKDALDFERLMVALDMLGDVAQALRDKPERKRVNRKLARFLRAERVRRLPSTVQSQPPNGQLSARHLDPLALAMVKPRRTPAIVGGPVAVIGPDAELTPASKVERPKKPSRKSEPVKAGPSPSARPLEPEFPDEDDDLDDLRKEMNWSASDA